MEAVAAIGLISNVIQLLHYGCKIVHELRQVRNSPGSFGGRDQDAPEARLRASMHIVKKMAPGQTPCVSGAVDSDGGHLQALCDLAQARAAELADVLATMRPPSGCSTTRKVRLAVLSVGQQAKVKSLSKDLGELYLEACALYHMQIG